jgi:para-nitrobenzyl esterase
MDEVVSTPSGRLRGREQAGVLSFRGVPYGAPPVGALRFRAPQPAPPWRGEREALEPGPTAPQVLGLMRDLPEQSEDCLTLNVWTPGTSGRHPVMVFLHGGGFTSGSAMHPMYDGAALALRGDVVVVSLNYRLGLLGFGDFAALDAHRFDSNPGLRDQLLGLSWVQRHIESFGGDPDRVTLFGQSAGAMCTVTLMASEASAGLFSRAIAQSGAGHHTAPRDESARIAGGVIQELGIRDGELEKLRGVPLERMLRAQESAARGWLRVGSRERPLRSAALTLVPTIDGDLVPEAPVDAAAGERATRIPLLTGTNHDEWDFWLFLSDPKKRQLDDASMLKVLEKRVPGHGAEALELYRAHASGAPVYRAYGAFETDRVFGVPAERLAQQRARGGGATYLYEFDFRGPLFDGDLGTMHTMEVPFVLGGVDDGFGQLFTGGGEAPCALSRRVMDAWVATDALGCWDAYDGTRPRRMRLARDHGMQDCPDDARWHFWDALL